jgi:hypothetical protein
LRATEHQSALGLRHLVVCLPHFGWSNNYMSTGLLEGQVEFRYKAKQLWILFTIVGSAVQESITLYMSCKWSFSLKPLESYKISKACFSCPANGRFFQNPLKVTIFPRQGFARTRGLQSATRRNHE